jgi:hypothetical protein
MSEIEYQPPQGFVDQYYIYVYDAGSLTDGQNYANLTVQMLGGTDFVLRRVAGVDSVVAPTGQYQIRDQNQALFFSKPLTAGTSAAEFLIVPERYYNATAQIAFDLYNVLRRHA